MQAMDRVHVVPEARKRTGAVTTYSRAWLLDPLSFHEDFDDLYAEIDTAEGLARMRWLATQTWRSQDDTAQRYVDMLRTASADDWEAAFDEVHLADWYRVLMAQHLIDSPAVSMPRALKERLPAVGFTPTEARRLAYGRELKSLVETFGSVGVVAQIAPLLTIGCRGWLSQDDIKLSLHHLHGLDPRRFRDAQDLVPLVEQVHAMLDGAAQHPDHVLLLLCD
jgi:hypothetical protein